MAPRSRLPLSPSMEARLSSSQDSLHSTGSNQELKTQLDSTLAEVEAIAEHLEKQKKVPLEKSVSVDHVLIPKVSPELPKPSVRRKASDQLSNSKTLPTNGARPRERVSLPMNMASTTSAPNPVPRMSVTSSTSDVSSSSSVILKQSSWASREHIHTSNGKSEPKAFSQNKSMWERRTTTSTAKNSNTTLTSTSEEGIGSLRGGFRSNRDFWNQRVAIKQKQKQTPDLVLDLPASPMVIEAAKPKPRPRGGGKISTGTGASDSLSSSNSNSSGDENLAADQFANSNRNTLRKSTSSKEENIENNSAVVLPKKIPPVQARLQRKSPPRE